VAIDDADSPSLVGFTVASYLPVGVGKTRLLRAIDELLTGTSLWPRASSGSRKPLSTLGGGGGGGRDPSLRSSRFRETECNADGVGGGGRESNPPNGDLPFQPL